MYFPINYNLLWHNFLYFHFVHIVVWSIVGMCINQTWLDILLLLTWRHCTQYFNSGAILLPSTHVRFYLYFHSWSICCWQIHYTSFSRTCCNLVSPSVSHSMSPEEWLVYMSAEEGAVSNKNNLELQKKIPVHNLSIATYADKFWFWNLEVMHVHRKVLAWKIDEPHLLKENANLGGM